ncbi:chemotaxis protein CheW [Leptolyngbya ohadii]|uniref:chemotaxis protein CheW n=1 Tax=Leptolyngbya ohadii TaxID=1962290 RepID=UPI000B59C1CD|nr:chemotaxis protein CheW [Leptolyngbya ohadii]
MTAQALTSAPTEGLHLQFILDRSLPVLLPAPSVVEILTVSVGQIVPIFQLPPWVMGVYNWRGEVLWMVDLNHLLGLTPWYEQEDYGSQHTVIVLRENSEAKEKAIVGLAINQVQEVVQCTGDCFYSLISSPEVSSEALPDAPSEILFEASSETLPEALSDTSPDTSSEVKNTLVKSSADPRFADLQRFLCGFWQLDEDSARYGLLNSGAIFQCLSELSSF